jgi:ABC-type bacteriocin/lantibiotic exporter with double-glycine peptidase domain
MPVWHRSVWHTAFQLTAAVLMALPSLLVMVFALPLAAMTVMAVAAAMACACVFVAQRQAAAMTAGATPMMSWLVSAYETLREIETVRAHAAEARFFGRWADGFLSTRERMLHAQRIACYSHAIGAGASALLAAAALAAVLYFSQSTNLATATVFVLAAMTVAGSMSVMIGAIGQYGMLSMQRRIIAPMLEAPPAVAASGAPVPNLEGAIDVDNVSLRRSPDEPCALDSVSFRVEPGSYVGIAGPSGSGKSTLLRVLAKMDTPTSGHVTFDGIDIQNLDGSSLRRRIGIVAQSGRLFPGTILENIAAGVPITPEEAWEAARLACASDDIETMPLGMSTPVSDANPTLSGGQIQRILIARAVVKKPAVLLLDEATSALDPDCEAQVIANLRRRNVTIVAVAHRLETIMACDRIHVIDRGQIVESGTFEELADGDTLFAALIAAQAEEPDAESPASCPSTRPAASAHRFAAIAVQSCETSDRNTLEPQTTDARRI